jgi:nicotinamidase-related amidase
MATALLLIDIQNDYFPGGAMVLDGMDDAAAHAAELLAAFRARGWPVVHVQHLSVRPGSTFFVPGTPGVQFHAAVSPQDDEPLIQKNFPNAFRDTRLLETLQQMDADKLLIAGAMSHMCIDATTRAAFDLGFRCSVAADACATRALEFNGALIAARDVHYAFMAALRVPYAAVATARESLAALSH